MIQQLTAWAMFGVAAGITLGRWRGQLGFRLCVRQYRATGAAHSMTLRSLYEIKPTLLRRAKAFYI
jgi:hypothetical protein